VRLPASELGDQGEHGSGPFGLAIQSPQHDFDLLSKGAGKDGSREKLRWVTVV
jgi:hypothetical protein